jgi:hypothetical protein
MAQVNFPNYPKSPAVVFNRRRARGSASVQAAL